MKRLFSLLLCLVLIFSLAACKKAPKADSAAETSSATKTEAPATNAGIPESTNPETKTTDGSNPLTKSTNTDTTEEGSEPSDGALETPDAGIAPETPSEPEPKPVVGYNPAIEHKILATDITNHSIVVFDLNACDGDPDNLTDEDRIVWEWDPENDPNCTLQSKIRTSISGVKFRHSAYYQRDVVVACATYGWVGVIDYQNCSLLWECDVGYGPHSVEMLPNGDVVVGASFDPGAVYYIPLSAGITEPTSSFASIYCHGVCWDPVNQWVWVLEDTGVYAASIKNMGTAQGEIVRIAGSDVIFGEKIKGGHALAPIYGEPGKYWVSAHELWIFDSKAGTLSKSYSRFDTLSKANIKGIASFSDGTVMESIANLGGHCTKGWSCDGIRVVLRQMSTGKVPKLMDKVYDVIFDTAFREFYKIFTFSKAYQ